MKRLYALTLTTLMVMALGTTSALAAGDDAASTGAACTGYVDADHDGVCDHLGEHCANIVDSNNDGVCDTCGKAHCAGWQDADHDGVCDTCKGQGSHTSEGQHGVHAASSGASSNRHGSGRHAGGSGGHHSKGHGNGHD